MKAYGHPRWIDLDFPDLGDIHEFGLKSAKSRVRGKSGDFKNSFRKPAKKRAARRVWKKRQRAINKRELFKQIENSC